LNPFIEPFGVVTSAVAIILFVISFIQYARGRIKIEALLFWEVLWIVLFLTGVFPGMYESTVTYLGMATPIHFVTTFSIIFLFIFTFLIYQKISDLNKKVVEIVQNLDISEDTSKKGKRGK